MTAPRRSAGLAPHRMYQSCAHRFEGEGRQLLGAKPSDVVMLLRSDVRRRPLPFTHEPRAEPYRLFCRSGGQSAQVRRRGGRDLHPELFVELSREGTELGLTSLHESTGQIPDTRVRAFLRTPIPEQNAAITNQRADSDLMHSPIATWSTDKRASAHSRGQGVPRPPKRRCTPPRATLQQHCQRPSPGACRSDRREHAISNTTSLPSQPDAMTLARLVAVPDLARYSGVSQDLYAHQLRRWLDGCEANRLDQLVGTQRHESPRATRAGT